MELNLSSLVDLAIGKPHNLNCTNFDILHTLLHVILKKTNTAGCRIELTGEMAMKTQSLLKSMPMEPSISFKEVRMILLKENSQGDPCLPFSSQPTMMAQNL